MSTRSLWLAVTLGLAPAFAHAGGFDLTGQPIDIIFEEGNYIEGRLGLVVPDVEGSNILGGSFGNTAVQTPFINGGAKTDFTDRISGAIIFDTPFLRESDYQAGLFAGTAAEVEANSLTAVGRFKINENFSVYAGPRVQFSSVDLQGPNLGNPIPVYQIDVEDEGFGYVVGASFEIPEYLVRAAITYNSQIDHEFDSTEFLLQPGVGLVTIPGEFGIHTPQSVNLDVQFPVTTSTLVKGSVRWADWGGVEFDPPGFAAANNGRDVVAYTEDVFTYRLTVAQRINENFVGFVTGSYEEDGGEEISLFKTVDGGVSLGGGVIFENGEGLRVTLGGEYRWLNGIDGPQIPTLGGNPTPPSSFDDPTALAFSMKVGYSF